MLSTPAFRRTRDMLGHVAGLGLEGAPGLIGWVSGTALTSLGIMLVNLGSGIAQARGLGPQGRGELAIAMLWPTLLAGVGALGIREATVYRAAREPAQPTPILVSALTIGAGQTLLLALIGWVLFPVLLHSKPPEVLQQTLFYLWILPLFPLTLYPNGFFQGRFALGSFNVTRFCVNAASTGPLIALWLVGRMTVHSALAASLAATAATAALCLGLLLRRHDVLWRPSPRLFRPLLWFGVRLHVGNVATIVAQRLDLVVLSLFVATASLGTYAVATSAGLLASLLPTAASFALYPAFARQSPSALPTALARFLVIGGLTTLLIGPFLVVLVPMAVPLVFGQEFAGAVQLTAVLALGYLVRGWNLMLSSIVGGTGRPFSASVGPAVEFGVLGGLLLALVPRFGTTGAAASVLGGAGASFLCLLTAALLAAKLSARQLVRLCVRELRGWRRIAATSRQASVEGDLG